MKEQMRFDLVVEYDPNDSGIKHWVERFMKYEIEPRGDFPIKAFINGAIERFNCFPFVVFTKQQHEDYYRKIEEKG